MEAFIYLSLGGQQGRASPWAAVKPRLQQVPRGILKLGSPPGVRELGPHTSSVGHGVQLQEGEGGG